VSSSSDHSDNERPPYWARLGWLSTVIADSWPLRQPPVLLLSLPRSGSNWAGEILGTAPDAVYLREPLTQTLLSSGPRESVFAFAAEHPPVEYRQAARRSFAGLPCFPPNRHVIEHPEQWSLADRARRRLVVKEVNPYLCDWLVGRYQPRLIVLLRHPAAIALSHRKLAWWPAENPWYESGAHYCRALHAVWQCLQGYPAAMTVAYEELCLHPLRGFGDMFEFSGLKWDAKVEDHICHLTNGPGDDEPYSLIRSSAAMANRWRGQVAADDLAMLKAGYSHLPLPWYQSPDHW
jgi:hypothetical protein